MLCTVPRDLLALILDMIENVDHISHVCTEFAALRRNRRTVLRMTDHIDSLAMFQWAYDHGCPWNNHVSTLLAQRGKLDLLQWAHTRQIIRRSSGSSLNGYTHRGVNSYRVRIRKRCE